MPEVEGRAGAMRARVRDRAYSAHKRFLSDPLSSPAKVRD